MNFKRIWSMAIAAVLAGSVLGSGNINVLAADVDNEIFIEAENNGFQEIEDYGLTEETAVEEEVTDATQPVEEMTEEIAEEEQTEDYSEKEVEPDEARLEDDDDFVNVTLNANGGLFPDGHSEYDAYLWNNYGQVYIDEFDYIPKKDGYAFNGWFADPECTLLLNDEGTARYIPVDKVKDVIYAGWTDDFFTITFDGNGGKIPEYWEYFPGESPKAINLRDKKIVLVPKGKALRYNMFETADHVVPPEGMEFKEWNTMADGSGDGGSRFWSIEHDVATKDLYLYAQYNHLYTLNFDAMGGSFPEDHYHGIRPEVYDTVKRYSDDGKSFTVIAPEGKNLAAGWSYSDMEPSHHYYVPDDPISPNEGEVFLGWCLSEDLSDPMTTKSLIKNYNVAGDTYFYAKYGNESELPEEEPEPEERALTGAMKNVKIAGLKTTVFYTGSKLLPSDMFNASDATCKSNGWNSLTLYIVDKKTKAKTPLVLGRDYAIDVDDKSDVGKVKVTFNGKGGFTGSISRTITIKALNVAKDLDVNVADAVYSKAGVKPAVTVSYNGKTLVEGQDYTVTYKNNKKAALSTAGKSAPYIIIKAKGNYAGTTGKIPFTIQKADVSNLVITAKDIKYKANGKKGYFLAKPVITDNDKKVTVGKNKDIKAVYTYTYAKDTTLKDGTVKSEGETVDPRDKLAGPTSIKVTAQIEAGGSKSSYEGTASLSYVYEVAK